MPDLHDEPPQPTSALPRSATRVKWALLRQRSPYLHESRPRAPRLTTDVPSPQDLESLSATWVARVAPSLTGSTPTQRLLSPLEARADTRETTSRCEQQRKYQNVWGQATMATPIRTGFTGSMTKNGGGLPLPEQIRTPHILILPFMQKCTGDGRLRRLRERSAQNETAWRLKKKPDACDVLCTCAIRWWDEEARRTRGASSPWVPASLPLDNHQHMVGRGQESRRGMRPID